MCTVSFVPTGDRIIITSNRDEKTLRPGALEPRHYQMGHKKVFFPKDPQAGGTWYAVDEYCNVLVLLNGAEEKHTLKQAYRKSRGLIVLDLMSAPSPLHAWYHIDLSGIEPFTIVLYENQLLYQLRWNEVAKDTVVLDSSQSYIWSSSTLYPKDVRAQRAQWFASFLMSEPQPSEEAMFHFHRYTEEEDTQHGLVINRNDVLKTLSITQTVIEKNKATIHYADLLADKTFSNSFISV